jgi:hypothetical protein
MTRHLLTTSHLLILCMCGLLASTSLRAQQPPPAPETPDTEVAQPDAPDAPDAADAADADEDDARLVPELTYEQYPGLAYAASKIYFTDQTYSISGFGEFNVTPFAEGRSTDSGDLELYYTGLYRLATFFGYKLHRRIIFNFEFLGELLHDGTREVGNDIVIEAMLDFVIHQRVNVRLGYSPLPIGYINNNDEPVMFFSVNRPEVERLILPTSWISLGAMAFGRLPGHVDYFVGRVGGLNSSEFIGASWVRQGRQIHHGVPEDFAWVGKVERPFAEGLVAGVSGYRGGSGDGRTVDGRDVRGLLSIGSAHAKFETRDLRLLGVSTWGTLRDTEDIHALTGEVLGRRTYGYYLEAGHDLLPLLGRRSETKKAPIFARYERLNTHRRVADALRHVPRVENDLRVVTVGANYSPRRSLVFKANYQFQRNFSRPEEGNRAELGVGFIY